MFRLLSLRVIIDKCNVESPKQSRNRKKQEGEEENLILSLQKMLDVHVLPEVVVIDLIVKRTEPTMPRKFITINTSIISFTPCSSLLTVPSYAYGAIYFPTRTQWIQIERNLHSNTTAEPKSMDLTLRLPN